MKWTLFFFLFSFSAWATESVDYMARIERMIESGVITAEAARAEQIQIAHPTGQVAQQRGIAQRGLASITPELKPLKIKRFKAKTMVLLLD